MLDGEDYPRFIWRTTEATIKPLSQVDGGICVGRRWGRPHGRVVAPCPQPLFRLASEPEGSSSTTRSWPYSSASRSC